VTQKLGINTVIPLLMTQKLGTFRLIEMILYNPGQKRLIQPMMATFDKYKDVSMGLTGPVFRK